MNNRSHAPTVTYIYVHQQLMISINTTRCFNAHHVLIWIQSIFTELPPDYFSNNNFF